MSDNKNLQKAKKAKNDEFYTLRKDVDNELQHYIKHFKDKVIYCNCDTENSEFVKYFKVNANVLGIKELLYSSSDFRGKESIELLKKADIVVTNPPFSLFREYIAQLVEYNKKFLIIGNKNAIGYKEIFPLLKENKMWLGCTVPTIFTRPDGSIDKLGTLTRWFTNLDTPKRHEELFTGMTYKRGLFNGLYPQYDNCEAINVNKVKEIPTDYEDVMGVPITYLGSHNPDQYSIVGFRKGNDGKDLTINGKVIYSRILIKKN